MAKIESETIEVEKPKHRSGTAVAAQRRRAGRVKDRRSARGNKRQREKQELNEQVCQDC